MAVLLLLLLFALPVAELAVLIRLSQAIGVLDAIGLLLLTSLVGVWLTRRAGLSAVRRIRRTQEAGRLPSREMTDGALGVAAGVLLVVPGFITDVLGVALFLPPVRAGVRALALRWFRRDGRVVRRGRTFQGDGGSAVVDVESWEEAPVSEPRPQTRHRGELGGPD
jgi:UPF0716 protein FxsA